MIDAFIFILEILGTIAFSISGAMVAFEKKMDIFGVAILGMTTAVGGGIVRDLILGYTPPAAFREPVYPLLAIAVALIAFIKPVRKHLNTNSWLIIIIDSVGLGIFTVVGTVSGLRLGDNNIFLAIFVGALTGVGGGVLRDVFAGNTPYIFVKHFYASASVAGAIVCALLWHFLNGVIQSWIAMLAGAVVTIVLRLLAAKFRWKLPK